MDSSLLFLFSTLSWRRRRRLDSGGLGEKGQYVPGIELSISCALSPSLLTTASRGTGCSRVSLTEVDPEAPYGLLFRQPGSLSRCSSQGVTWEG